MDLIAHDPPRYTDAPARPPPDYSPSVTVTLKNSVNELDILQLEVDGPPDLVVYPGAIVSGRVVINPSMAFRCTSVQIELRLVEASAQMRAYGESTVSRIVTLEKVIVPESALPENNIFLPKVERSIAFTFQLPFRLAGTSCMHGMPEHYMLPPTIGGTPEKPMIDPDGTAFPVRISYRIHAKVMGEDKPLLTSFKDVRFATSGFEVSSSLGSSASSKKELKSGKLRKSSIGSCELTLLDPPVLNVYSFSPVNFELQVAYTPPRGETEFRCIKKISYKLMMHAITAPQSMDHVPQINEQGLHTYTKQLTSQKIEFPTLKWIRKEVLGGELSENTIPSFSSVVLLPLVLPEERLLPPFSTCFSTVRYSVDFTVFFGGSTAASSFIQVPVDVVAVPLSPRTANASILPGSVLAESMQSRRTLPYSDGRSTYETLYRRR